MAIDDSPSNESAILGVVLAGGRSRRFGSDKALARIGDDTLLDLAIASLRRWCDIVVVAGRGQAPVMAIPDWPKPGCGPLGGIAAGLAYGEEQGFASVLTCGVDSIGLPPETLTMLSPAPAFLVTQPVVGHWPVAAAPAVKAILMGSGKHSTWRFTEAIGARAIKADEPPANINKVEDLAKWHSGRTQQK